MAHRLSILRQALAAEFSEPIPNGDKLRKLAQDGRIPAFQVNHIWHFHEEDVEGIGRVLGLKRTPPGEHLVSARREPVAA